MMLTVGQAAEEITRQLGLAEPVPAWRIRRLYELGVLPDAPRNGRGERVLDGGALEVAKIALYERGWLPSLKPVESPTRPEDLSVALLSVSQCCDDLGDRIKQLLELLEHSPPAPELTRQLLRLAADAKRTEMRTAEFAEHTLESSAELVTA